MRDEERVCHERVSRITCARMCGTNNTCMQVWWHVYVCMHILWHVCMHVHVQPFPESGARQTWLSGPGQASQNRLPGACAYYMSPCVRVLWHVYACAYDMCMRVYMMCGGGKQVRWHVCACPVTCMHARPMTCVYAYAYDMGMHIIRIWYGHACPLTCVYACV
jgi:hypothetical protein